MSTESLLGIALGLGLAAATGFRIFVPMLIAGLAARADWIALGDAFAWIESTPALVAFATAAALESLAYYIPGVDHVLDLLAGPAAAVAGIFASAAVMTDVPPAVMWPIAIIAGGSTAGLTKATTAIVRAKTSVATVGLGNPVVSTAETAGAAGISMFAVLAPVICLILVAIALFWAARKGMRWFARERRT